MSIKREVETLLTLGKRVEEESIFQQQSQYKNFKSKKNGHRSEIKTLILGLQELEFNQECIFWCHKFLQNRDCDRSEKFDILYILIVSYYKFKNYLLTIYYGKKCMDIQVQKPLSVTSELIQYIINSSKNLNKIEDTLKFLNDKLKKDVLRYNAGEIKPIELLKIYYELIYCQISNKNFKDAMKTIKTLKLFNMNAKDTNDVLSGRGKYFSFCGLKLWEQFSKIGS